jgi:hypothetical protein
LVGGGTALVWLGANVVIAELMRKAVELPKKASNPTQSNQRVEKRNLFERQWVSRDFKKNTGFSIDEMQTTLKALGECLKKGALTAEFKEPMDKLKAPHSTARTAQRL